METKKHKLWLWYFVKQSLHILTPQWGQLEVVKKHNQWVSQRAGKEKKNRKILNTEQSIKQNKKSLTQKESIFFSVKERIFLDEKSMVIQNI